LKKLNKYFFFLSSFIGFLVVNKWNSDITNTLTQTKRQLKQQSEKRRKSNQTKQKVYLSAVDGTHSDPISLGDCSAHSMDGLGNGDIRDGKARSIGKVCTVHLSALLYQQWQQKRRRVEHHSIGAR